ncbi:MAG: glycosyltransferase N-terminal domain-containing protein [Sulfitobacter sp.]
MARSLGLAAYRALARRGESLGTPPDIARPPGELLWIHAAEPGNMIAILDLATRICAMRTGLTTLITQPESTNLAEQGAQPEPGILFDTVPTEHPDAVAAFLDHWQPGTCLWLWGGLRPNLVLETAQRNCPMILLDADPKGFDGRRDRWMPDLTFTLLAKFSAVMARSKAGQRRLIQIGFPKDRIEVTSPLLAGGQALTCADSDLSDMSEALGGRPVWFAARVQPAEVPIVLAAHRQALRLSHRLLLILNPASPADARETALRAADDGFDVIQWEDAGEPDDTTQVMVIEDSSDRGLFFRVAPVSFLGSSLVQGGDGCDPFEAAALGSAVLYGPKVRRFLTSYSRLAAAGAARIVNDAAALGTAVTRLIAPDQAATMAHAGWDVVSHGAELTDKVTDLVQESLDQHLGRS